MSERDGSTLTHLLVNLVGSDRAKALTDSVAISPILLEPHEETVPRRVLAMAMNLLLFQDVMQRVPLAGDYVQDEVKAGRKLVYDHGAIRTVATASTPLPAGHLAFARILEPLGYRMNGVYPLDRLGMTGRAYAHADAPEDIPQFFVSELHPERFSPAFQEAVQRVLASTRDPLPVWAGPMLERLTTTGELDVESSIRLLPFLVACFERQHEPPFLSDYQTLLAESAEMAWIATEGNAFNHATNRVPDVAAVAESQKKQGRPMKEEVEISSTGRILQTAFRAAEVERVFVDSSGKKITRKVPGSFFEFITRKQEADGKLDLRFDAANAQAIFKMTATEWC